LENKLKPLKQESLTKRTIAALREYIIEESLSEGFKLPPERILAEQLGVSRNIIRESLKSLEANGIIKKYHGKGAFITPFNSELVASNIIFGLKPSKENFMEFLDFHETFEKYMVRHTISKLDKSHIIQLEAIIDSMKTPGMDLKNIIRLEYSFFKKIINVLKNIALRRMGLIIIEFFLQLNLEVFTKYALLDPVKKQDLVDQYNEIMQGLKAGDSEKALEAIRYRYKYARNNFYDFD